MARTLLPSRPEKLQLGLDDEFVTKDMLARFGRQYAPSRSSFGPGDGDPEDIAALAAGMAKPAISRRTEMSIEVPPGTETGDLSPEELAELEQLSLDLTEDEGGSWEDEAFNINPELKDILVGQLSGPRGPEDIQVGKYEGGSGAPPMELSPFDLYGGGFEDEDLSNYAGVSIGDVKILPRNAVPSAAAGEGYQGSSRRFPTDPLDRLARLKMLGMRPSR